MVRLITDRAGAPSSTADSIRYDVRLALPCNAESSAPSPLSTTAYGFARADAAVRAAIVEAARS